MNKIKFMEFRCIACGAVVDEVRSIDGSIRRFICPECGEQGEYHDTSSVKKASHLETSLEETLENAKHFNFRGIPGKGEYRIPKVYINAIINWSGYCTDPHDLDTYKNPEAMFEALDLIYKILDPIQTQSSAPTASEVKK